jgi:CBS domain-containing protein
MGATLARRTTRSNHGLDGRSHFDNTSTMADDKAAVGHPCSRSTIMRNSVKLFLIACALGQSHGFSTESARRVFVSTPVSKFPRRLVGDCMTGLDDVTAIAPMTSTDEAMATLLVSGLSGAPVVDRHKKLVGVVSSFDFLQKEAFEGALLPMEGSRANVARYVQAAQKICGQVVADIMTPVDEVSFFEAKGAFTVRTHAAFNALIIFY